MLINIVFMKTRDLQIRGLNFHIQEWGDSSKPLLVLLHGWMDCGATYKFIAEYLKDDYYLVAPDLRGFGKTDHAKGGYWFPDYYADLEKILDVYAPARAVNLVGHSMGGNIALSYAGINPQRVNKLMSLEALGMPPTSANEAPRKYRQWLGEILSDEPSKVYPNLDSLHHSIYKGNPTLSREMIEELARLWGQAYGDSGAYRLRHDHAHRYTNPVRYNFDDTLELWKQVTARIGVIMASDSPIYQQLNKFGRVDEARSILKVIDSDYHVIDDSSHMLHLEQPKLTARLIDEFFSS